MFPEAPTLSSSVVVVTGVLSAGCIFAAYNVFLHGSVPPAGSRVVVDGVLRACSNFAVDGVPLFASC